MKTPKYTDTHRHARGYADSAETEKPGYLARRFAKIRAEQAEQKAATEAKVQPIKRAVSK